MKPRSIVIDSLPQAYEVIKEMNLATDHDDSDYRKAGRRSLENILEDRMQERISYYLEQMARLGEADRRNGHPSANRYLVRVWAGFKIVNLRSLFCPATFVSSSFSVSFLIRSIIMIPPGTFFTSSRLSFSLFCSPCE